MSHRTMTRRQMLALTAGAVVSTRAFAASHPVNTVTGPVRPSDLGRTLMHEHLLIDFIGADALKPGRYDVNEAFSVIRPYLEQARAVGIKTLVDATPEHLGRNVDLMHRLSEATGLQIVACTGIYGARDEKYIPAYARTETAEQLAARYAKEIESGIGSTGIKPGIIKLAVIPKPGHLSAIEQKLVRAAALAHNHTGLLVEGHTDQGHMALEQLEVFASVKAPARAFVWVHAHEEQDHAFHIRVGKAGAWVEFDGIRSGHLWVANFNSLEWQIDCVRTMKNAGLFDRVLLSQDAGWYQVGEPKGGPYHGFTKLSKEFVPRLKAAGFTGAEIDQLQIHNPANALGGA
jgi:predicted metal-dependent phosphotriesterase family hydrolase